MALPAGTSRRRPPTPGGVALVDMVKAFTASDELLISRGLPPNHVSLRDSIPRKSRET
jgi:hypothetical protein